MTIQERNVYLENIPVEKARAVLWDALHEAGKNTPLAGETVSLKQALARVTSAPRRTCHTR
ncbi:MAG: hypothetical protein AAFN11_22215 [Chloroflexota bacterium]